MNKKLLYLLKSHITEIRTDWLWYLILIIVQIFTTLLFIRIFAGDNFDFVHYTVGSIVTVYSIGTFLSIGQKFAVYKHTNAWEYYMTLPITKFQLITSLILKNIILCLPSTLILIIVGSIFYETDFYFGIPFFVSFILVVFSLAFVGALVGIFAKKYTTASVLTQILNPIFIYLAPVYVASEYYPEILRKISYLIPTTYCANALKNAMLYNTFSTDMLILAGISIIGMFLVLKKIKWVRD